MTTQTLHDPVTIWTTAGVPARFVWRGRRYRITDRPTPLRTTCDAGLTHPLEPLIGWRFQGTDDAGDSSVYDVRRTASGGWELVAVYV